MGLEGFSRNESARKGQAGSAYWVLCGRRLGLWRAEKGLKCRLVLSVEFINLCHFCPPLPQAIESWLGLHF